MGKAQDDPNAVEMPDFTPEQIDYILMRVHQQQQDGRRMLGPVTKATGKPNAKQLAFATHVAQAVGFTFNALGLWAQFPPSMLIACMRGDDPFAEVPHARRLQAPIPTEQELNDLDANHTV